MTVVDLGRAADHIAEAIAHRSLAAALAESPNPYDKASSAQHDCLADRCAEWAIGALKNDLGQENVLGS